MTLAERIAGLPTAVNIVKPFQAQLTQRKDSGQTKPAAGKTSDTAGCSGMSTTELSIMTKSLYAADRSGYTKADAINKQWKKMNTLNLFDVLDGTADTSNRTLSAKDVEMRIREEDLLNEVTDVDLSMLKFELSGLGFFSGNTCRSVAYGEFNKNVEYLASRYSAMEDKIKGIYTGTEQEERLDQLNDMYGNSLEKIAKTYSEIVGGILEDYGVSGEKEKIYQSFKSGVEQKVDEYRKLLEENHNFAGLEGTEDEWLLKDDEYIAAMLREQKTDDTPSKNGGYSLRELDVLGQYASSLSAMIASASTYETNEERIGLELAVLAMKTDTLGKDGNMSSAFQSTIQKAFNGYLDVFIDQFNQRLEENRKDARIAADINGNAGLHKDSVWSVYHKTMEQYRISGDAMEALIKGARYGQTQYAKKMNSGQYKEIYRYKNGSAYWNDFFEAASGREANSYRKTGSTFEKYMVGWMDFKNSLSEGTGVRMNLSLKSMDFSCVGQNGSRINVNV